MMCLIVLFLVCSMLSIAIQDWSCYVFVEIFIATIWHPDHSNSAFCSYNFDWIACLTSFFAFSGATF